MSWISGSGGGYVVAAPGPTPLQTPVEQSAQLFATKLAPVNVMHPDFGAKGDGVADDTAAIQAAINFCIVMAILGLTSTLYFPVGNYKVTSTLFIQPPPGLGFIGLDIKMDGGQILWAGGSNTNVFHTSGWVSSTIDNVFITVATGNNCTGLVQWDLDTNMAATPTQGSTGRLRFTACNFNARNAGNTGCTGWRICNSSTLSDGSEASFIHWDDCRVAFGNALTGSTTPGTGNIAIQNTGGNQNSVAHFATNLNFVWCDALLVTNTADWHFWGGGGSFYTTLIDATGLTSQDYGDFSLTGLRCEGTARIINASNGGNRKNTLKLDSCFFGRASVPPVTGDMFTLNGPWDVIMDNCTLRDRDYTATFSSISSPTAWPNTFHMRGGGIQLATVTNTPFNITGQPLRVKIEGTGVIVSGTSTQNYLGGGTAAVLPTVASVAALPIQPGVDTIQVTGTTNITSITGSPLPYGGGQYAGRVITLMFTGILTVTNGANLLLNGGVNFTTAANSTLTLMYTGTGWIEIGRKA